MTLQEYIDQVRKILDEYDTDISFWTDDELTVWLNEGLKEVSKKAKYLTQRAFVYPVVEEEYPLPGDYIDYYKVKLNGEFCEPIDIEEDGEEEGYYIWGETLYLSNVEEGGRLVLYYYRNAEKMTTLNQEAELPEQYEDIIIPFCLYRAFMKDKRTDEASLAQQEFFQRAELMRKNFARKPSKTQWKVVR